MSALLRRNRARLRSIRVGTLTGIGLLVVVLFAITAKNGLPDYLPGVSRTEVRAEFTDVGALRRGDDVRVAGVRVGFVDSIRRAHGLAVVDMRLDGGRKVYHDAAASIGARSALGQKFVALQPGSVETGEIAGGATIPTSRTSTSVELDTVLDTLDAKTLAATQSFLHETGGGVAGHGQDLQDGLDALPAVLDDLGTVSRSLSADHGEDVVDLLHAADSLAGTLEAQHAALGRGVRQLAETTKAIDVDGGAPLRAALEEAPDTLTDVRHALKTLDEPLARTAAAATALRPGAVALSRAVPDVRALMRSAVTPLGKVPGVAKTALPAVDDVTTTLGGARPLVLQLATGLDRAARPLTTLAPYSQEIVLMFKNLASSLQYGDAAGNWLRFTAVVNTQTLTGALPIADPLLQRDPYPAPGQAAKHNTSMFGGHR